MIVFCRRKRIWLRSGSPSLWFPLFPKIIRHSNTMLSPGNKPHTPPLPLLRGNLIMQSILIEISHLIFLRLWMAWWIFHPAKIKKNLLILSTAALPATKSHSTGKSASTLLRSTSWGSLTTRGSRWALKRIHWHANKMQARRLTLWIILLAFSQHCSKKLCRRWRSTAWEPAAPEAFMEPLVSEEYVQYVCMCVCVTLKSDLQTIQNHSLLSHSCRRSPGAGGPTVQVHEHWRSHHLLVRLCNRGECHPCLLQEGGHRLCVSAV